MRTQTKPPATLNRLASALLVVALASAAALAQQPSGASYGDGAAKPAAATASATVRITSAPKV
ncbi:MAG TPA: hypothetical protein VN228_01890, partial [Pyrinomonadaceae bacterium]|nr:hypothetical protein [Pyrinomonadaceae bacterium]